MFDLSSNTAGPAGCPRADLRTLFRSLAFAAGCVFALITHAQPAQALKAADGTVTVVEYYNAALDHYFITADSAEIGLLDGGAFGGAWKRTGSTFPAWGTGTAPAGTVQVCRFSGTDQYRPDGSRIGPNSHFYAADPGECSFVRTAWQSVANDGRAYPAWTFEGMAFAAKLPVGGVCPVDTQPLYRAYNDGARGNPNHRYSTNAATLRAMPGWSFEGVVMCLPASSGSTGGGTTPPPPTPPGTGSTMTLSFNASYVRNNSWNNTQRYFLDSTDTFRATIVVTRVDSEPWNGYTQYWRIEWRDIQDDKTQSSVRDTSTCPVGIDSTEYEVFSFDQQWWATESQMPFQWMAKADGKIDTPLMGIRHEPSSALVIDSSPCRLEHEPATDGLSMIPVKLNLADLPAPLTSVEYTSLNWTVNIWRID